MVSAQRTTEFAIAAFAVLPSVQAFGLGFSIRYRPEPASTVSRGLSNSTSGQTTFSQLVDHVETSLGTFSQRYWWSSEFWGGPGSPVVLVNAGELRADGAEEYLTVEQLSGALAKELGAAVVAIEHRYYGDSTPFRIQDTKALQHHTLDNAMQDMIHFARTVALPFDTNGSSNAPRAPWVLSGCSYAGMLAAYIQALAPGTFWAYHTSSAPVQLIYDFWQFDDAVRRGIPRNCSEDMVRIIEHIDDVLDNGTPDEITGLKAMYGLEALVHHDDFANALQTPNSLSWQGRPSGILNMCDAIEGARDPVTLERTNATDFPPEGVGLERALKSHSAWYKANPLPTFCSTFFRYNETGPWGCYEGYNLSSPAFTDWSSDNVFFRPWVWELCDPPFAWWGPIGAPRGQPSMVSRHLTSEYWVGWCDRMFPRQGEYTHGIAKGRTVDKLNARTGGWFMNATRLVWVNGELDPWREASVSATMRPGGGLQSTPEAPVYLVEGGHHCPDYTMKDGLSNPSVKAAQDGTFAAIKGWVNDFYHD